ncbi:hypothetical protein [Paenibacillus agaridevorans]|nr:hypothetical protein [Paenibacillus agaridevorans]
MNSEVVNAQVSRLPIAMAGIVHGLAQDGRSLSTYDHTDNTTCEEAPTLT